MATIATVQTTGFNFGAAANALIAKVKTNFARNAEYNRVYSELASLNARELADIGIARSDIRNIAKSAADMI